MMYNVLINVCNRFDRGFAWNLERLPFWGPRAQHRQSSWSQARRLHKCPGRLRQPASEPECRGGRRVPVHALRS